MIAGFLLSLVGRFSLPSKLISGLQLLIKLAAKVFTLSKAIFNFSTQTLKPLKSTARKASRKFPRLIGLIFCSWTTDVNIMKCLPACITSWII